jgi:hypothetical protein
VLNAAGPFRLTAEPLSDAAIVAMIEETNTSPGFVAARKMASRFATVDGTPVHGFGQSWDETKFWGFRVEHDGYSRQAAAHFPCGVHLSHCDHFFSDPRGSVADRFLDRAE